jgi:ABC-2 type transport system ATP-binding protein
VVDSETLIRVEGLGKTYGKKLLSKGFRALDGVSLEVGRGRVFGLLGPNGAGKTTLLKILLGLARPTDGRAFLFGEPIGRHAMRRRIGYLPEAHRLPGYLTGRQVIELFGMMCGRDKKELRARMPELLSMVGMAKSADRRIKEYSKGMQQRIGLAQALIHEPDLIFLDEPTDGVDPVGRAAIRRIVEDLKARGTTIFINSHLLMVMQRTGRVRFDVEPMPEKLEQLLDGVGSGLERRDGGFELRVEDAERDQVIDRLRAANVSIRGLIETRLDLEQAFIETVRNQGDAE